MESVADVAACGRVILSLPDSAVSHGVANELVEHLEPDTFVVDTTTGDPRQMAALGQMLGDRGVHYLDACVGGSSEQCRRGEVIVICGGEPEAFAGCSDLFATIARRTFHVGQCGAGARMKLVMNLVLGLNRAALAEGLSFAQRQGLDLPAVLDVLKAGPAASTVMDTKGEKMINRDFTPQARLAQHLKDVRLIQETGRSIDAALPFSNVHALLLERLLDDGLGEADNSAVIEGF